MGPRVRVPVSAALRSGETAAASRSQKDEKKGEEDAELLHVGKKTEATTENKV